MTIYLVFFAGAFIGAAAIGGAILLAARLLRKAARDSYRWF